MGGMLLTDILLQKQKKEDTNCENKFPSYTIFLSKDPKSLLLGDVTMIDIIMRTCT